MSKITWQCQETPSCPSPPGIRMLWECYFAYVTDTLIVVMVTQEQEHPFRPVLKVCNAYLLARQ